MVVGGPDFKLPRTQTKYIDIRVNIYIFSLRGDMRPRRDELRASLLAMMWMGISRYYRRWRNSLRSGAFLFMSYAPNIGAFRIGGPNTPHDLTNSIT